MVTKNSAVQYGAADYDFRGTFWGMTKDGVKHSETHKPESESASHLSYKDQVLELDAIVGYHFIDDSLVEAGYAFRDNYDHEGLYIVQYGKIKDHLSVTFGNPNIGRRYKHLLQYWLRGM